VGTAHRQEVKMKIELTEKQLDTILEGLDFWQGSLIGIEEYATEYKRACKIEEKLREKARNARV
jgi:hypothetical protein